MDEATNTTAQFNPLVHQNPEADARAITEGLGGIWQKSGTWQTSGAGYVPPHGRAPCPVCQPARRSDQRALCIEYGVGIVALFCDGACCAVSDIVQALRRSGIVTSVRELGYFTKGWDRLEDIERHEERARRHRRAKHIWEGSQPIQDTPAELRLRKMGITCPLPDTLRFHPNCWHPGGTRRPAMVALLNREFWNPGGVHLTYLPLEGSVEDAEVMEVLLGEPGQAVTIVDHPYEAMTPIVVADTIPSALALASGLLEGKARIWVALSPEGMEKLWLPEKCRGVDDVWWWEIQPPGRLLVVRNGAAESRKAAEALAERADSHGWGVEFLTTYEGHSLVAMLGDPLGPRGWKLPAPEASTGSDEAKDQSKVTSEPKATEDQTPTSDAKPPLGPSLPGDTYADDLPF